MPSARPSGLALSVLGGAIAASIVSVVLVFLLPGGSGSIDQALPQTGPLGALISNIVPLSGSASSPVLVPRFGW